MQKSYKKKAGTATLAIDALTTDGLLFLNEDDIYSRDLNAEVTEPLGYEGVTPECSIRRRRQGTRSMRLTAVNR